MKSSKSCYYLDVGKEPAFDKGNIMEAITYREISEAIRAGMNYVETRLDVRLFVYIDGNRIDCDTDTEAHNAAIELGMEDIEGASIFAEAVNFAGEVIGDEFLVGFTLLAK